MLRPKLVLLLTEILQNPSCLRNTTSFIPPRYRKSRGTSHYATEWNKNDDENNTYNNWKFLDLIRIYK